MTLLQQTPRTAREQYEADGNDAGAMAGNNSQAATDTDALNMLLSPEPSLLSETNKSAEGGLQTPEPQARKRCEIWPMTYRSADGRLKMLWCLQVDGKSFYQYLPPNIEELSRYYQVVYFQESA